MLARHADEVMEPLTRQDTERTWRGHFVPVAGQWGFDFGWASELGKERARAGLLKHLESLPWPYPGTVQVLLRDQDDDCFFTTTSTGGALRPLRDPDAVDLDDDGAQD